VLLRIASGVVLMIEVIQEDTMEALGNLPELYNLMRFMSSSLVLFQCCRDGVTLNLRTRQFRISTLLSAKLMSSYSFFVQDF
jgi:hypothetical protein